MKKVLVTGVDGFTGQYVADELNSQGYEVIALVHKNPEQNQIACDLTDKQAVKDCLVKYKPDAVIHLAALSFVGHADQKAFYDVNVFGCLNILESVVELGLDLKKIVLASSANIYGNPTVKKISEDQVPSPVNHYAMSKLAMEHMAKLWFNKLPIVITRPFNYTGCGQQNNFLIPKIVSHFKENKAKIELGNLDVSRDFSDVRDIARIYIQLLESNITSEVFNLCSGSTYSLNDIINITSNIAGYNIDVTINPDFVRDNEIKVLYGDNKKLRDAIGYQPQYTLEKTLFDMYHN